MKAFFISLFLVGLVGLTGISHPAQSQSKNSIRRQWDRHVFAYRGFRRHETSLPGFSKDLVFVGSQNGKFYAYSRPSGQLRWHYKARSAIRSQPGFSPEQVIFGDQEGKLHCLEISSGKSLWILQLDSLVLTPPIFSNSMFFVQTLGNKILALDAQTGKQIWEVRGPSQYELSLWNLGTLVQEGSLLYAAFPANTIMAIDKIAGEVLWKKTLGKPERAFTTNPRVLFTPEFLVVAIENQGLFALDRKTGDRRWEFNEPNLRSATILDEKAKSIYGLTTSGIVYTLDTSNGKIAQQNQRIPGIQDPKVSIGEISGLGKTLFFGNNKNQFWAFSAEDGRRLWTFNPWFNISGFPNQAIIDPECFSSTTPTCEMALWAASGTLYLFQIDR